MIMSRIIQVCYIFCAFISLGEYIRKDTTVYEKAVALAGTIILLLLVIGIEVFIL